MDDDTSSTMIITVPRRVAVPVAETFTVLTPKTCMKYVGAGTEAVTRISRIPVGFPFASVSCVNDGVDRFMVPVPRKPLGKLALKNCVAVVLAAEAAALTESARFIDLPAASAAASTAEESRPLIMYMVPASTARPIIPTVK